jgi:flagellar biosynthesis protein FliQ
VVGWYAPCLSLPVRFGSGEHHCSPDASESVTSADPPVSHQLVVDLCREAITMALLLAGPMLVIAMGVGLLVSVIQAVTQIQEQTLVFVPKLLLVAGCFLVALPWLLQQLVRYTTTLFRSIPTIAG